MKAVRLNSYINTDTWLELTMLLVNIFSDIMTVYNLYADCVPRLSFHNVVDRGVYTGDVGGTCR